MSTLVIIIFILIVLAILVGIFKRHHIAAIVGGAVALGDYLGGKDKAAKPADSMPTIAVKDEWFDLIKSGKKPIEGRLKKGFFTTLNKGDKINIRSKSGEVIGAKIVDIREYPTIKEMLETEKLDKVVPGKKTVDEGIAVYREFYDEAKEKEFGMIAIELKIMPE